METCTNPYDKDYLFKAHHRKTMKLDTHSKSAAETIEIGKELGKLLTKGDVVALIGELGSGKTYFTKGIAQGLEVPPDHVVNSPSFTLVNSYEGRLTLYHMDSYRLKGAQEFINAGLEEYFYMEGVVVLEWADKWPELLPAWHLKVRLDILGPNSRRITFEGDHQRACQIIEAINVVVEGELNPWE